MNRASSWSTGVVSAPVDETMRHGRNRSFSSASFAAFPSFCVVLLCLICASESRVCSAVPWTHSRHSLTRRPPSVPRHDDSRPSLAWPSPSRRMGGPRGGCWHSAGNFLCHSATAPICRAVGEPDCSRRSPSAQPFARGCIAGCQTFQVFVPIGGKDGTGGCSCSIIR